MLRVYISELAHSSVEKAVTTLGLGLEGIKKIPVDDQYRMSVSSLAEAIAEDRRAGVRPICVVATVGLTTSCTSIDPVPEIADLCDREKLWLHVDAAYGGTAAIVPEMRHILAGCDRANSLVVNPHKWMFVPVDLSVLFTRSPEVLRQAFSLVPDYLRTEHDDVVRNLMDYGVPLVGRRFRALKLWFVIRYFGVSGLAERLREHVEARPELEGAGLADLAYSLATTRLHFEQRVAITIGRAVNGARSCWSTLTTAKCRFQRRPSR